MSLNIRNAETLRLAQELADRTGETLTDDQYESLRHGRCVLHSAGKGKIQMAEDSAPGGILILEHDDEERELAFELAYLSALTVQERFELMFRKSREIAEALLRHGHREPVTVIKRS
jgi:hypothetical protein